MDPFDIPSMADTHNTRPITNSSSSSSPPLPPFEEINEEMIRHDSFDEMVRLGTSDGAEEIMRPDSAGEVVRPGNVHEVIGLDNGEELVTPVNVQEVVRPDSADEIVRPGSAEEIVAQNVSQQLLDSALEAQRDSYEPHEDVSVTDLHTNHLTIGQQVIEEEDTHEDFDIQNEQRNSGFPIHQYIYDEEEEDEAEDEEDDEDDLHVDTIPVSGRLVSLPDDNKDNPYGYGTGLSIGGSSETTPSSDNRTSIYELNKEDPFSTPQKHKTHITKDQSEEDFQRFVDKCEPFETITTDIEISRNDEPKSSLLDFDSGISQMTGIPNISSTATTELSEDFTVDASDRLESVSEPNPTQTTEELIVKKTEDSYLTPSGDEHTPTEQHWEQSKSSTVLFSSANPSDSLQDIYTQRDTDIHAFAEEPQPNLDTKHTVDSKEPTFGATTEETHIDEDDDTYFDEPIQPIVPSIASQSPKKEKNQPKEEPVFEPLISETPKPVETMAKRDKRETSSDDVATGGDANCPCGTLAELVYWRDPKKSGPVFGVGLIILLSLTVFSIISVVAYASLAALSVSLSFRIYKNILQAVQKTNEGHPFKEYLEVEITPSPERIHQIVDNLLSHLNCTLNKLRSVFLVEDIIDSLKFVVLFWCLTYIGSWFNGLTLIILAYLALFSLPKVYELNKTQIDQYISLATTQINDITEKIRSKIPFPAKKDKEN
ncbi:reticulon-3-like isoform X2 [Oppia nitens]|uniref:reticulon-3-like isoform X2 n=1 Tax=Oppia nitens TaxID=1686743 RepID=UPI0023DABEDF|nr:reticulon-3-like isoform X2 [Oppia nitens]